MIKPYLYGGLVLLIVGLFSFTFYQSFQIDNYQLRLETADKTIKDYKTELDAIKEDSARKQQVLESYLTKETDIKAALDKAVWLIKGYTKRDTPNEKCLDMSPPDDLLRMHSTDSVSGQGDLHGSKPLPAKAPGVP